jgi:hypothetical protein
MILISTSLSTTLATKELTQSTLPTELRALIGCFVGMIIVVVALYGVGLPMAIFMLRRGNSWRLWASRRDSLRAPQIFTATAFQLESQIP